MGDGVGRLQGRDDAFQAGAQVERRDRFAVGGGDAFDPVRVAQPGVLGT